MEFVSREAWGARQPLHVTGFTPSYGSTVHYEGPRMGTFAHASCATKVRGIQAFHMDQRGWADIAYTAVVCPHGVVFEGRWLGHRTGANGTNPGNASAYAVCALMGQGDPTPEVMVAAIAEVMDFLRDHGGAGPKVNGHRDWKPTSCPGDPLYQQVQAGRFLTDTPTTPPPPPPTPEPTEEQEIMGAADDIVTELKTYIDQKLGGSPARELLELAQSDLKLVRAPGVGGRNGRVYLTNGLQKRYVADKAEAEALAKVFGLAQKYPEYPEIEQKFLDRMTDLTVAAPSTKAATAPPAG